MTGTFSSFNTALSALRYQRIAMDVASSNIANVNTPGYVRRRAEAEALGGPSYGLWSRYDGVGDGVAMGGLTRMSDALLDARSRVEHGKQSFLDVRYTVLGRVENGLGEPGDDGVAAALATFRNSWQDLESHPDQEAVRGQVIAAGQSLATALNGQAANLTTEEGAQRGHLLDVVSEANSLAQDLAGVNKSIADASAVGEDDGALRDQRDVIAQRLSELTGGVTSVRDDGGIDVSVGGRSLVSGKDAATITITGGVAADGSATSGPLTMAVGGTAVAVSAVGGELGAVGDLLTTTLPGLRSDLDAAATELADSVNALHTSGYDQDGTAGTAFFSYDPADPAASLGVAVTDPRDVVASADPGGGLGTGVAAQLGEAGTAESAYQSLVSRIGTMVASASRQATTQQLQTSQVDSSREQLSGVDFDEETVNLVAAQRAYEAASRVMSTMDDVLDTLINRTAAH